MTASLMDYLIATTTDMPDITVFHEENWSPDTEGGFKGVGEGGVIGVIPAMTNAIADALHGYGARITQIPVRPEMVMAILDGKAKID